MLSWPNMGLKMLAGKRSPRDAIKVSTIGSRAWLVEAPGKFDLPSQRRIWSLAASLRQWTDVESLIPGVTNLLVVFRQTPIDYDATLLMLDWYDGHGQPRLTSAGADPKRASSALPD